MDKKTVNLLLSICSIALLVAGFIFLCISIFGDSEGTAELFFALGGILLGNLFNLIRIQLSKQDEQ